MGRPAADKPDIPLVTRVFTVLAAVCLVGAIALGSMLPPDMSLNEALHAMDAAAADGLQHGMVNTLGKGLWDAIFVPLLMRPVWLLPLSLGLICVGGALTARFHATPRTKHRNS